jgi:hypothetical protein
MSDSDGFRPPLRAIRSRRQTRALIGVSEDGTVALLTMPDGVDDAPLGTRCAICGARASGRDLFLMLVDVGTPGAGTVRRLASVHPQCTRHCAM